VKEEGYSYSFAGCVLSEPLGDRCSVGRPDRRPLYVRYGT